MLTLPVSEGDAGEPRRWSMTVVYTVLTGVVIGLTLLLFLLLGRQPKVQATSWSLDEASRFVVDGERQFAVTLPDGWTTMDAAFAGESAALDARLATGLVAALEPWPDLAADLTVDMLAEAPSLSDRPGAFLLVAHTAALAGASPELIVEALRRRDVAGEDVAIFEDFDRSHVVIPRRVDSLAPLDECRQWIHPGRRQLLVAVYCVPEFGAGRIHREAIRLSIQNFR